MKYNMKKITSIILIVCMTVGLFACAGTGANAADPQTKNDETNPPETATETPTSQAEILPPEESTPEPVTEQPSETPTPDETPEVYAPEEATLTGDFVKDLEKYLKENGYFAENYVASPTSYRAALCLAIAGANGGTKDRLLKAAGFNSVEEANDWYNQILASIESFNAYADNGNFFELANAVWNNSNFSKNFKESYIDYVSSQYGAGASSIPGSELMNAINSWCDKKTHGMIKEIVGPEVYDCAAVLANALYLKANWMDSFTPELTEEDVFYGFGGVETTKQFMKKTDKYKYYSDGLTMLVSIPLDGRKNFVCVMGMTDNLSEKLDKATYRKVNLRIPKMDIESSFARKELVDFLIKRGAGDAFDMIHADFTNMYDKDSDINWYIDDIIQKARIKTDENGLEAAAVTAITIRATGAMMDPEEVVEFNANEPFSFYVIDAENGEILFFGQMMN